MVWWDKVLKYKDVNLYSGLGLYMADLQVNTYGWKTDQYELYIIQSSLILLLT